MALTLLLTGLAMNVIGILLGSSRDLSSLVRGTSRRVLAHVAAARSRFGAWWARRIRRHQRLEIHSGSLEAKATGSATADGYAWYAVPDDATTDTKLDALISRTDKLHELIIRESDTRRDSNSRLTACIDDLSSRVTTAVEHLDERIDDFDVRPAGQRAMGAVLVIAGTILMFVGGLVGA